MNAPRVFEIPPGEQSTGCRSCGARIVFVVTAAARRMPVDFEGPTRGQSHFVTCDDPKRFRKRDRIKGPRA